MKGNRKMKARIYYSCRYTDPKRNGGNWWYKDFQNKLKAENYIKEIFDKYYIDKVYLLESDNLPYHNPMKIKPPIESVEVGITMGIE